MIQDKEAISKKNSLHFFSILVVFGLMVFVLASFQFHPSAPLTGVNEDVTYTYNFSLNFTGTNTNITQVNVTLPSGFSFNAPANFSQQGSTFTSLGNVLSWENTSYWFMNGSLNNLSQWFAFNATAINPGDYNITIAVLNATVAGEHNVSYFNLSVSINDTTSPDVGTSNFSSLVSNGNYSGVITLNISIADNLALKQVYLNITNSSADVQQNISTLSNTSASAWNFSSFDTTSLGDGLYNVTIWANDSNNNLNNSAYLTIRIDNTAPTGTISCTPSTVQTGNVVTCTCAPTDAGSGINSASTVYTTSPSTENTGTFTQTCSFQDNVGLSGVATSNSYTVELSSSSGGSSGGSTSTTTATFSYSNTISKTNEEFSQIQTIETSSFSGGGLGARERVTFKFANEEHHVGIREITTSSAIVEIASDPIQVELDVGEEIKQDLDGDGFYDVYVKLNSITNGKANLTINYIHEEILEGEETPSTTGEQLPTEGEETKSLTWLWIIIGVAVIAAIISAVIALRKPKKKK